MRNTIRQHHVTTAGNSERHQKLFTGIFFFYRGLPTLNVTKWHRE